MIKSTILAFWFNAETDWFTKYLNNSFETCWCTLWTQVFTNVTHDCYWIKSSLNGQDKKKTTLKIEHRLTELGKISITLRVLNIQLLETTFKRIGRRQKTAKEIPAEKASNGEVLVALSLFNWKQRNADNIISKN